MTAILAIVVSLVLLVAAVIAPRPAARSLTGPQIHFNYEGGADDGAAGSMYNVARQVGASTYWGNGYYGQGVDVALIDSGVAPVAGLDRTGKLVYGPDVSYESGADNLRNLDTYGHGTNMAGIIAGRGSEFRGIAPAARLVSLTAADAHGRTNVGQIIASIKWVTQHAHDNDLNIRVLNLSFGANAVAPYQQDDLAFAVEQAWNAGIVTVVSAGNNGTGAAGLDDPAFDPYVIAVGADNPHGTTDVSDDNVSYFSSRGDGARNPDVVAPGRSIVSLRVPGSYLDETYPNARVSDGYFRGSGTSQAAAVVSGAAALIVSQRPQIGPDGVKALLKTTARSIPNTTTSAQGDGLIDLRTAYSSQVDNAGQEWAPSHGSGDALWSSVPDADGNSWSQANAAGNSWSGNSWTGNSWTGNGWSDGYADQGNSWSTGLWQGVSWGKRPKGR